MENQQLPPNFKIWQTGLGFVNTNVLYALVKTGVPEQLRDNSKTVEHLAADCKLNTNVLFRVLRYCIAIDVIALNNNQYSLTEMGRFLLKDVPGSMYMVVMLAGVEPWQKSWNNLSYALKTGAPAFDNIMGSSFFDYLNNHPEYSELFNKWMTSLSTMFSKAITEAYDFSRFHTICDIGGGHGQMLKGILLAYPSTKGILYDQESVIKNHLLSEFTSRVEIESGNFFESVPSADALIMKLIIHDWDDNKSIQILNACKKVMTTATKLLIIERVIGKKPELQDCFYDLHMQVLLGARERTEDEFRNLLQDADLKLNRIISTNSPLKIIEVSI